jgi:putative phosphoribosyl transferase
MIYKNRTEAGANLAEHLLDYKNRRDVLVLALPRGGVPVAYEVARRLYLPLDIFVVRKLGIPGQEEMAMGAIATGGIRVLNEEITRYIELPEHIIEAVADRETKELERRERLYRSERAAPQIHNRTVILVDDGLATGSSMRVAIVALRRWEPAKIIVAVPVGAADTCAEIRRHADEMICAATPEPFLAVGQWYEDFSQTSDREVRELLARAVLPQRKLSVAQP